MARGRRVAASSLYGAFICLEETVAPADRTTAPPPPEEPRLKGLGQPVWVKSRIRPVSPRSEKGGVGVMETRAVFLEAIRQGGSFESRAGTQVPVG